MKGRLGIDPRGLVLRLLFGRWRRHSGLEEGYSILLPTPMDMPFLLRYSLDGLSRLETPNCRQIVVIPDGCGTDRGRAVRGIVESAGDPRIELVDLRRAAHVAIHRPMKPAGPAAGNSASNTHWATIVEGIDAARCEYCFLHDADAFFVGIDGLERLYRECRDRRMYTLGVEARSDRFFEEIGCTIPGTWELMFSTEWAMRRDPTTLKGRWRSSRHGMFEFDNMLYPQYLDAPTGKIGLIDRPPKFLHFSSAVITYRVFRYGHAATVVDELFRLLFLALLEELEGPAPGSERALPPVAELARGLTDRSARVAYDSPVCADEYPIFRRLIEELCETPVIGPARAEKIRTMIRPFDHHFQDRINAFAADADSDVYAPRRGRRHGLS